MTITNPNNGSASGFPRRDLRTVAFIAIVLGVTERSVRNYIARGILTGYRIHGTRGIRLDLNEVTRQMKMIPAVAHPAFGPNAKIVNLPRQAEVVYPTDSASS